MLMIAGGVLIAFFVRAVIRGFLNHVLGFMLLLAVLYVIGSLS